MCKATTSLHNTAPHHVINKLVSVVMIRFQQLANKALPPCLTGLCASCSTCEERETLNKTTESH